MKKNVFMSRLIGYVALVLICIVIMFPFVILFSTSLKGLDEIRVSPYGIIPQTIKWENYVLFFESSDWGLYIYNSSVIAIVSTVVSLFTNSMAGYAFARLDFKGRDTLFKIALLGMMVPMQTIMIPIYLKIKNLPLVGGNDIFGNGGFGFLNSPWGVIAPLLAGAFGLFMARQYFATFPSALDDAARIDGCSAFMTFIRIYLPLSKPMLATLAILKFTDGWNQYTWPLVVNNSNEGLTVQVALAMFRGSNIIQWDLLMAGTIITCLPVLIIFLLLQKYYVQGIVSSGIKG